VLEIEVRQMISKGGVVERKRKKYKDTRHAKIKK